jgi:hypothetical protein
VPSGWPNAFIARTIEVHVGLVLGLGQHGAPLGPRPLPAVDRVAVGGHQPDQGLERGGDEVEVVADELDRRVDLVGHAGGQAADSLQLLGVAQLQLEC